MEFKEYTPKRLLSPRVYLRNRMSEFQSKMIKISKSIQLLEAKSPTKTKKEQPSTHFITEQFEQSRVQSPRMKKYQCNCENNYSQILKENQMYNQYFNTFESEYAKTKEKMTRLIQQNKQLREKIEQGTILKNQSTEPTKREYIESESECSRPLFSGMNSKITLMVPENTERFHKVKSRYQLDDLIKDKHTRSHYF